MFRERVHSAPIYENGLQASKIPQTDTAADKCPWLGRFWPEIEEPLAGSPLPLCTRTYSREHRPTRQPIPARLASRCPFSTTHRRCPSVRSLMRCPRKRRSCSPASQAAWARRSFASLSLGSVSGAAPTSVYEPRRFRDHRLRRLPSCKSDVALYAEGEAEVQGVTDLTKQRLTLSVELFGIVQLSVGEKVEVTGLKKNPPLRPPVAHLAHDRQRLLVERPRLLHCGPAGCAGWRGC